MGWLWETCARGARNQGERKEGPSQLLAIISYRGAGRELTRRGQLKSRKRVERGWVLEEESFRRASFRFLASVGIGPDGRARSSVAEGYSSRMREGGESSSDGIVSTSCKSSATLKKPSSVL
jgi:hypothetical protein